MTIAQLIRESRKNRNLVKRVLKRDKFTCQECKQHGGDLEVDHIVPFSQLLNAFLQQYAMLDTKMFAHELQSIALKHPPFWDTLNLRTLCRKCNWMRFVETRRKRMVGT